MIAQQQNASTIVLEHRYYGLSNPFDDLSDASLKFHTIQQAIDDLVFFAENVDLPMPGGDQVTPDKAPWILIGGSYSGKETILHKTCPVNLNRSKNRCIDGLDYGQVSTRTALTRIIINNFSANRMYSSQDMPRPLSNSPSSTSGNTLTPFANSCRATALQMCKPSFRISIRSSLEGVNPKSQS